MNQAAETKEIVIPEQVPATIDINPQALIAAAISGNASIEVMERLLAMRERLQAEAAERAFREAMSSFQSECPVIPKTKIVLNKDGSIRYKYAPLDDIVKIIQPYLQKNGLSYKIETETIQDPPQIKITVKAYHLLGHCEETSFQTPVDKNSYMNAPQQWASCSTFTKRYTFCNAFGILTGDEDTDTSEIPPEAEKNGGNGKKQEQPAAAKTPKEEAAAQLAALPENVKKGFKILDYKSNAVFNFCKKYGWNNDKILSEINKLVDAQA